MESWGDEQSVFTNDFSMDQSTIAMEDFSRADYRTKEQFLQIIDNFHNLVHGNMPMNLTYSFSKLNLNIQNRDELECDIEVERITNIMGRTIDKCRIAMILPLLFKNNGTLLKKFFSEPAYLEMILALRSTTEHRMISLLNHTMDDNLNNTLTKLAANQRLLKCSKKMRLSKYPSQLLTALEDLKSTVVDKMAESAKTERTKEAQCIFAYRKVIEISAKVEKLQATLDSQNAEFLPKFKSKDAEYKLYKAKMESVREKAKESMMKRVIQAEINMVSQTAKSEIQQVHLAEEARIEVDKYQKMLEDHISVEKNVRASKFKVESQLASWLAKYDADIRERQEQLETLESLYEIDAAKIEELKIIFDKQEIIFQEYLAEKTQEDEAERILKFRTMLKTWAARRIQRFWRAYRVRKIAKKKAKKAKAAARAAAKGKK